jgi:hypothetical protein
MRTMDVWWHPMIAAALSGFLDVSDAAITS